MPLPIDPILAPRYGLEPRYDMDFLKEREDPETLIGRLGGYTIGGLEALGNILDTPGSIVRGLLAGDPGRAFGGIFDPSRRIDGRELGARWGILSENDPEAWEWQDFAGFGIELATDPLTFLQPFGRTAKGVSALKTKSATKGLGKGISKGERTLARFEIPFTDVGVNTNIGLPDAIASSIGGGFDTAWEALRYKNPVGRKLGKLFSHTAGNMDTEIGQKVYGSTYLPEKIKGEALNRQTFEDLARFAREMGIDLKDAEPKLRQYAENAATYIPIADKPLVELAEKINAFDDAARQAELSTGLNSPAMLDDLMSATRFDPVTGELVNPYDHKMRHVARSLNAEEAARLRRYTASGRQMSTTNPSQKPRQDFFRGIPTHIINQMAKDEALSGQLAQKFDWNYRINRIKDMIGIDDPNFGLKAKNGELDPRWVQIKELMHYLENLPSHYVSDQIDLFGNPILDDAFTRGIRSARTSAAGNAGIEMLGKFAKEQHLQQSKQMYPEMLKGTSPTQMEDVWLRPDNSVTLEQALRQLNYDVGDLTPVQWEDYILSEFGNDVDVAEMLEELADNGLNMDVLPAANPGRGSHRLANFLGIEPSQLRQQYVTLDQLREIASNQPRMSLGAADDAIPIFDAAMNAWKIGATIIDPSFSGRNFISGQVSNLIEGAPSYWQAFNDARKLAKGEVPNGLGARLFGEGVTDEDAMQRIMSEYFTQHVSGGRTLNQATADITGIGDSFHQIPFDPKLPGDPDFINRPNLSGLGSDLKGATVRDWLTVRGVGSNQTKNPLLRLAENTNEYVEYMNRMPMYLAKRMEGYTPEAAKELVDKVQFNYGNLSQFEKDWMRRIFPFYSFARMNLPRQAELLATKPAKTAALVRAGNAGRGDDHQPEYIRSTMAVPLRNTQEGGQSWITGFGLPIEEAVSRFNFNGLLPNVGATVDDFLAMANPAIKAPLEMLSGRQFFSGRPLDDLNPPLGQLMENFGILADKHSTPDVLEHLLANSPVARGLNKMVKVTDPRNYEDLTAMAALAANLTTGIRSQNISPDQLERSKRREAMDALRSLMSQDPNVKLFEQAYIPSYRRRFASPETMELLEAWNIVRNR